MTLNEFDNINEDEFCSCSDNYNNFSNDLKKFAGNNPMLTTGIIAGSTLATASIINPTIRKITVPTCKLVAKQQLKFLAGVGVLSIATYIANQPGNIDDSTV